MKNKEFKKGIAIGVEATLVVTGAVFTSYQKVLFPKGNALSDVKTVQKLNYLEELIDEDRSGIFMYRRYCLIFSQHAGFLLECAGRQEWQQRLSEYLQVLLVRNCIMQKYI